MAIGGGALSGKNLSHIDRAAAYAARDAAVQAVRERYVGGAFVAALGAGGHFVDPALPWNQPTARAGAAGRIPRAEVV